MLVPLPVSAINPVALGNDPDVAVTVSPLPGKGAEQEVMVQGNHGKTVAEMLVASGVPEQWVKVAGIKGEKGRKK